MSETTDLLGTLNVPVLKALARKLNVDSSITRSEELTVALDRVIHNNVNRIVERLSEVEKKLAAEAAYSDGQIDIARAVRVIPVTPCTAGITASGSRSTFQRIWFPRFLKRSRMASGCKSC